MKELIDALLRAFKDHGASPRWPKAVLTSTHLIHWQTTQGITSVERDAVLQAAIEAELVERLNPPDLGGLGVRLTPKGLQTLVERYPHLG